MLANQVAMEFLCIARLQLITIVSEHDLYPGGGRLPASTHLLLML